MSKSKVLGRKSNTYEVILQDLEDSKYNQLWKKEKAKTEGYFIFENSNVTKVLTSDPDVSLNDLQIEGKSSDNPKHFLRWKI